MPILTPEERVGSLLAGKYQLERILGEGGMGVVFEATHTWTARKCAVKMLHTAHSRERELARRFLQEARTAAAVRHPNVVDVLDMGSEEDGTVYLVLELLSGEPLSALLKRNRLPPERALSLLLPAMGAIASAHERGIIHRDLKPDNIYLHHDHGEIVPKVLDFGLAKALISDATRTSTGLVMGTPYYIAPEQAAGDPNIGPPVDVWAMGVVMYEALAGRVPFPGDAPTAVILKVCTIEPDPLTQVAPQLHPALAAAVHGALVKKPEDRYANLREFGNAMLEAAATAGMVIRAPKGLGDPSLSDRMSGSSQALSLDSQENDSERSDATTTPLPSFQATPEPATSIDTADPAPHHDALSRSTGPVPAHPAAISSPNLPTKAPFLWVAGAVVALCVLAGIGIGIGLVVASGDPPPVSATELRDPTPLPVAASPVEPIDPAPSIPVVAQEAPPPEPPPPEEPAPVEIDEAPVQEAPVEQAAERTPLRRPRPRAEPRVQTLGPGPQAPRRPNISTQW
jgi:serine/threonine protein kinase